MDTTQNQTKNLQRVNSPVRDHGRGRRVYLDTYALKSRGISNVSSQTPVSTVNKQAIIDALKDEVPASSTLTNMISTNTNFNAQAQSVVAQPSQEQNIQQAVQVQHIPQPQPAPIITVHHAQTMPLSTSPAPAPTPTLVQDSKLLQPTHLHDPKQAIQYTQSVIQSQDQNTFSYTEDAVMPVGQVLSQPDERKIEANLRALYEDDSSLTAMLSKDDTSASLSHIRTIVTSAFACGVIAVSMFTFFSRASSQPVVAQPVGAPVIEVEAPRAQPSTQSAATNQKPNNRVNADPNHPVRFVIGSMGVNAPVQGVGMTPAGLMDVPKAYGVVGWYNKGMLPGQKGPAVMVGHYAGGAGAVFDKLADIKDGDLITVTNGKGQNFTYKVTKKAEYSKEQVPMNELFKPSDDSRLEIITCAGKWQAQNYDKRLVVSAELVR
jgi:LPXTG-site transpeptidase (sortase) family protein